MSQDPLRGSLDAPQTQNTFSYVGNNPTNRLDPSGPMWISDIGGDVPSKEGGGFERLCPNYDPTHTYIIIGGVCYDATPPACPADMNLLLCDGGEKGLFGFPLAADAKFEMLWPEDFPHRD